MPQSLYLIDGHAQIYRAYFAPFGQLSSPGGEPTRATHVFWQMVLNLLKTRKPDYLGLVLDVSDETVFRKEIYVDYKSHRDPPPEDLEVQAERIIQIAQAIRLPILRVAGFEADDILATLATRLAAPDLHVYLVSRDKDLDQLLGERVSVYDPLKDEEVTAESLIAIKGWSPQQAVDAQTLIGDSVDNVPGVPGIGPKTAAKLLQKYGTAQGVLEHADELSPKQRDAVRGFAEQLPITRQLVTLRRDVPIELDLQQARIDQIEWQAAKPIFQQLGFRKLPELLPGDAAESDATSIPASGPPPAAQAATLPFSEGPIRPAPSGSPAAVREGRDYRCINTPELLAEMARDLAGQPAFAIDTETTGVNAMDVDLVGIALAWQAGRGFYIPVRSAMGQSLPLATVRSVLGPICSNPKSLKIGHNLKYDLLVLRNAGVELAGPLFDTMIASFCVEPMRMSFGMDKLVRDLFGHDMIPISDLIGKGRDQLQMDQVPLPQVVEYSAEDADYTWRMYRNYEPRLAPAGVEKLFYDVEMPLVRVLAQMEFHGISLDAERLREMGAQMQRRIAELAEQVQKLVGVRFNLDSPKQLAEVLFDRLQMRVVRRTKTARSTDAETLETLAEETQHPVLQQILEYRELQKLLGTYVEALPLARSRRTGRVHTHYHQTGAITGRLSSSDPNLQNIPIRTATGREIRRAFVPRSPDESLIAADYSQIELRILADFSQDEALCRAFAEDRDIHAFVAAQVNGVPIEQVTAEQRSRAKAVNFGIIYGQTAFGLARTTGMSRTDAQAFIDAYFDRYRQIRAFMDGSIADARRDGFVRTVLGRRRPITDIDSRNSAARAQAERLAVNTVIQGSAADLIKLAMIRLHERIESEKLPLRMLLQVHDELVFEAPREDAERMGELVREAMSGALALRVPLKVDVGIAGNWMEA